MKTKYLESLIKKAREDAIFFHSLVFNPSSLKDLDPEIKKMIGKIDPSQLISHIISRSHFKCDENYTSSGPCGGTCGGRTCNITCTEESCGRTCDDSCGYTTDIASPLSKRF